LHSCFRGRARSPWACWTPGATTLWCPRRCAEASDALNEDIGALIAGGPKEDLALTTNTQPVMLVAGVACWRAWRAEGGALPAAVAGHSLGEYSALVAAEALPLAEAVPLVRLRAQAMQEAVPVGTGAMAAILGLDDDAVRAACASAAQGEVVEAVNFNAPRTTWAGRPSRPPSSAPASRPNSSPKCCSATA